MYSLLLLENAVSADTVWPENTINCQTLPGSNICIAGILLPSGNIKSESICRRNKTAGQEQGGYNLKRPPQQLDPHPLVLIKHFLTA